MKKVLSILALALALVACTDKPQWTPAAPSQPVVTSLTLDTAKSFSSNTLHRAELYHVDGVIVKLSLADLTDYEKKTDASEPHNNQLLVGISAAQVDSKDADKGILDCKIACVGAASSLDEVKYLYEALLAAEQAPVVPEETPETPEAPETASEETPGEGTTEPTPEETPKYTVSSLEWDSYALVPTTSATPEEKADEKEANVYKAPEKWGYIVRYTDVDGKVLLSYAILVDSYSITEAIAENIVELPNYGITTTLYEYSYSCVAGIQYKMFDAQGWK